MSLRSLEKALSKNFHCHDCSFWIFSLKQQLCLQFYILLKFRLECPSILLRPWDFSSYLWMQRPSFLKNRFIVSLPLRFPKVSVTSTNLLPSLIKKESKTQNKRTCKQVKTENQISTPAPSPSPPPPKKR